MHSTAAAAAHRGRRTGTGVPPLRSTPATSAARARASARARTVAGSGAISRS
jgi:hypothetical protein